ncbi:MAG: ABC transporter ATP-binding protein [Egibacteraceae bacterium]
MSSAPTKGETGSRGSGAPNDRPLLKVRDLSVKFRTRRGLVAALSDVDLDLRPGECRVVIGESGSGKSVLVHCLLGLHSANVELSGSVQVDGKEVLGAGDRAMALIRSQVTAFIPQSPSTALNPVRRVGPLLSELLANRGLDRTESRRRLLEAASSLGLDLQERWRSYPHQLSGGMQQRALTALALASRPRLVLADEPTSGLDAGRIEDTARQLRALTEEGAGLLVVTHDLGLARRLEGRIALIYGGRVVEDRPTKAFFESAAHPYGVGLLAALPERGAEPIPGMPPSLTALPDGCCYAPRCEHRTPACTERVPDLAPLPDGSARCILHA